jgi:predicted nucleotidyltransferase
MSDTITTRASGRFVLRIDAGLHAALRESARRAGISLNQLAARKLALPGGDVGGLAGATVDHAAKLFGARLIAVAVFGSWARRELADESDVDLLVVLHADVAISRALYRRWDRAPREFDGRRVEPHFVHLPAPDALPSGFWAEIAIDGLILFDQNLALATRLAEVRRAIADGRLVRRRVHGQSYWILAA